MIIYGSKMYGKSRVVETWGYCDSCGAYSKRQNYNARKWGHLYFIPLIPDGPRVRVLYECAKCSQGLHIPETEVPAMLSDLCQTRDNALNAILAGQKEFNKNGEMASCTASLASAVDLIYCLCGEDHMGDVLDALQTAGQNYAYYLLNGESLVASGKLNEAADSYSKAVECEPEEVEPLGLLGSILLDTGDFEGARGIYERALAMSSDKLPVLGILLTVYNGLGDSDKLIETYEACLGMDAELRTDKKFVKGYKKACKKIGRQPMAL